MHRCYIRDNKTFRNKKIFTSIRDFAEAASWAKNQCCNCRKMNIILVAVTFIAFCIYFLKKFSKPSNFPPGPPWIPYIGNQFYLKKITKSLGGLHRAFPYIAKKYNTRILGLKLGKEYVITVLDYPLVREVLIRDDFEGRPNNFFFKMRSFGREKSGITGSEGPVWSTNRTFVLRHFKSLGFGKLPMESMIKTEVRDILDFFENEKSSIQISKFFAPKVLNILWRLVSGERIEDDTLLDDLLDLFAMRGKIFDITGGILNQYPWLRFIAPKWSGYSLIQEINHKLKSLVMRMIIKHNETWEEDKEDDLLYSYISEIKKAEEGAVFCEEELVAVCFDLFIAGTQTTSGTLELLFFMMTLNPDIQKKVQEEIDRKIEKNAEITYADSNKLPYTSAVLMEIQRHSPVLPIIGPRRATKDTTLGGYNVPKNTTLFTDIFTMYHNEQTWPEPNVFRPERFLNEKGEITNPEGYIPFGLGKRRCLGDVLAKQCLFYFFVEIMRKFSVSQSFDSGSIKGDMSLGITLVPQNYRAKFTLR